MRNHFLKTFHIQNKDHKTGFSVIYNLFKGLFVPKICGDI